MARRAVQAEPFARHMHIKHHLKKMDLSTQWRPCQQPTTNAGTCATRRHEHAQSGRRHLSLRGAALWRNSHDKATTKPGATINQFHQRGCCICRIARCARTVTTCQFVRTECVPHSRYKCVSKHEHAPWEVLRDFVVRTHTSTQQECEKDGARDECDRG